ncbi:MAG TPA: ABC transporter substrate-binding protein, partial [Armatimonadota bacterium]
MSKHSPAKTWSALLRFLGVFVGAALFLVLLIEVLGWSALRLSTRRQSPSAPDQRPPVANPTISEWPVSKGRSFHQAPMLAQRKSLPPVAERLPQQPQMIVPPEQIGPYGGTWRRYGTDPADIQTYVVHRLSYPNLLRWSPMAEKILPNLAVRWAVADGARTFTLWLRKGVRWSDGVPFTADDILFWYNHVLQCKDLTPSIPREYKRGGELMTLEKVDDYTVRFHFKEPNGRFIQQMAAMPGYEMIDLAAHYFKKFHP